MVRTELTLTAISVAEAMVDEQGDLITMSHSYE